MVKCLGRDLYGRSVYFGNFSLKLITYWYVIADRGNSGSYDNFSI